jgi:hypothetical protein
MFAKPMFSMLVWSYYVTGQLNFARTAARHPDLQNRPRSYVRKEKSQNLSAASLGALKATGKGRRLTQSVTHTHCNAKNVVLVQ